MNSHRAIGGRAHAAQREVNSNLAIGGRAHAAQPGLELFFRELDEHRERQRKQTAQTPQAKLTAKRKRSRGSKSNADNEGEAIARMLALMSPEDARIIAIADKPDLSVDDKLRAIATVDVRYYGKTSEELAKIVRQKGQAVTGQAVRGTHWWKVERKAWLKKDARDRR